MAVGATLFTAVLTAGEDTGTTYGAGVTLSVATPIASLIATPADYVGRKVRVDGVVTAVCEHMGCWMELQDTATDARIRFKVEDGVIVFPVSAKGRRASAEGTFERVEVPAAGGPPDEEEGDAAASTAPARPATGPSYRIHATGAVVH
jgi:hypothetical protein